MSSSFFFTFSVLSLARIVSPEKINVSDENMILWIPKSLEWSLWIIDHLSHLWSPQTPIIRIIKMIIIFKHHLPQGEADVSHVLPWQLFSYITQSADALATSEARASADRVLTCWSAWNFALVHIFESWSPRMHCTIKLPYKTTTSTVFQHMVNL